MSPYASATLLFVAAVLVIGTVSAHPPSDLNLTYNQTTGNLSTTFSHQVKDSQTHFLKDVKIDLNGNETVMAYTSQPTADIFTYEYPVNASPKSVINVTGDCIIGGSITRSITV
jgi:hypothetical protein